MRNKLPLLFRAFFCSPPRWVCQSDAIVPCQDVFSFFFMFFFRDFLSRRAYACVGFIVAVDALPTRPTRSWLSCLGVKHDMRFGDYELPGYLKKKKTMQNRGIFTRRFQTVVIPPLAPQDSAFT